MKRLPSKPADRETVLNAIRRAVKAAGGKRISLRNFIASTGVSRYSISRYFPRWEQALQAAGFEFEPPPKRIESDLLLADWGSVARKLKRLPFRDEYCIDGKYHSATIKRRFNGWHNVPVAFRAFIDAHPEWADLLPLLPPPGWKKTLPPLGRPAARWLTAHERSRRGKQSIFGPLLDFGALRHAPVNEQGVVFLFGMLSEKLGFMVEALRAAFPDCEAKRPIKPDGWERVRIEFEYESRNFREHGHDPEGCDLIVCWTHNWPDCPVEVLVLGEEIRRIRGESVS